MVTPAQLTEEERFPENLLGRIGMPLDIGRAVAFLADLRSSYISGASSRSMGAQTAKLRGLD